MELRVLNYFLAVAREKNITAAARSLHISQPTLSRQLMDLEEEIGQTLMVRGNRRITLTEEGMLFRKRAEEIMSLVEKTRLEMTAANESMSGDIYIGAAETRGIKIIADTAKELQSDGYNIRYHISSGNAADVTEQLDKGLIDFGLIIGASNAPKYSFLRLPFEDRWGLLVRKDDPLAEKDGIEIKELRSLPIIASKQALDNGEFSSRFGITPDELNISATYNLLYNASVMVEEGLGCALDTECELPPVPYSSFRKSAFSFAVWSCVKYSYIRSLPPTTLLPPLREASISSSVINEGGLGISSWSFGYTVRRIFNSSIRASSSFGL